MSPNSVVNALIATKFASLEAVGNLHALFYHWHKLDRHERAIALNSAKHELERALVAVLAAEKEIAPTAKSEPSNVVQIGSDYQRTVDTVSTIMGGGDAA